MRVGRHGCVVLPLPISQIHRFIEDLGMECDLIGAYLLIQRKFLSFLRGSTVCVEASKKLSYHLLLYHVPAVSALVELSVPVATLPDMLSSIRLLLYICFNPFTLTAPGTCSTLRVGAVALSTKLHYHWGSN